MSLVCMYTCGCTCVSVGRVMCTCWWTFVWCVYVYTWVYMCGWGGTVCMLGGACVHVGVCVWCVYVHVGTRVSVCGACAHVGVHVWVGGYGVYVGGCMCTYVHLCVCISVRVCVRRGCVCTQVTVRACVRMSVVCALSLYVFVWSIHIHTHF